MISAIGNFLFRYRNGLFPLAYLLLFVPSPKLLPESFATFSSGIFVALIGQTIRAITIGLDYIVRGGRKRQVYADRLVTGGIFSHCRNPLYLGNYLILLGVGIASNSQLFFFAGIPFFTVAYWTIIAAEEAFLLKKFGREFTNYCARTNRLVPRFSGIGETLRTMEFNWRRLLAAEYGSAYCWMAGIVLLALRDVWISGRPESSEISVKALSVLLGLLTVAYLSIRALKKGGLLSSRRI